MSKFPVRIRLAVLIGWLVSSSTSHANEFSACVRANSASKKIELCSLVIRHSRQARQLERAYLRRGNAYTEVNRFADAVNDFNSLVHINPKVAGYYDNRQYALKSMGHLREALDDANMTIRLAPTYSFGFRSRGNVNDAMGRYDFAIADYTKGISIEPRDVGLLIDRGKTLAKAGHDREAIADFSHALDIDYNAVAAFRERGLVYKKLGDISAAIADLTWFTGSSRKTRRSFELSRRCKRLCLQGKRSRSRLVRPKRKGQNVRIVNHPKDRGVDRPGPASSFLWTVTCSPTRMS